MIVIPRLAQRIRFATVLWLLAVSLCSTRTHAWQLAGAKEEAAPGDSSAPNAPADYDDEPLELPAGLRAEYSDAAGHKAARVDPTLRFTWDEQPADPRLGAGNFSARWSGKLLVQSPGPHTFHLYAAGGEVRLSVAGQELFRAELDAPRWLDSRAIELEFGHQALEVQFDRRQPSAELGLYWSGPRFELEPVPERLFFHDVQPATDKRFEQGRMLVRGLRCAACHEMPESDTPLAAPSLEKLSGNVTRAWLMNWIGGPAESKPSSVPAAGGAAKGSARKDVPTADSDSTPTESATPAPAIDDVKFRMPGLGLSRDDARHIIAFLSPEPERSAPKSRRQETTASEETLAAGEELFYSLGCVACHALSGVGSTSVFGGGDLTNVGDKRPREFFTRWLAEPSASNPAHRMPVFPLSHEEREQLADFLAAQRDSEVATNGESKRSPLTLPSPARVESLPIAERATDDSLGGDAARGRALVERHQCAACHGLSGTQPHATASRRLIRMQAPTTGRWQNSCLGEPDVARARPGYRLRNDQRAAVIAYFEGTRGVSQPAPRAINHRDGADVLLVRNCLGCHSRGLGAGISDELPAVLAAHQDLEPLRPALVPPSLSDVGDKLERAAILSSVTTATAPRRSWLKIRMPKFAFVEGEAEALADWLIAADRLPDRPADLVPSAASAKDQPTGDALLAAGSRLVTSAGFGCASCHKIGKSEPQQENLGALGTDLSLVGERVRQAWFDRWVRNPARIVPRMEMPSIEQPVPGVLNDRLPEQLAAVWHVLNRPGFTPPAAGAIRIVRTRNMPSDPEPATVLTDVIRLDKRAFVRPLIIGLPNRHTVLFDCERNRLAGWWIGDAARERTEGKRWFWEPGGTHLVDLGFGTTELQLLVDGRAIQPEVVGQCAATLDGWEHEGGAVTARYRLMFKVTDDGPPTTLHVSQTFSPVFAAAAAAQEGFRRRIEVSGAPLGSEIIWRLLPEGVSGTIDDGLFTTSSGPAGPVTLRTVTGGSKIEVVASAAIRLKVTDFRDRIACEVAYASTTAADHFPQPPPVQQPRPATQLTCVPGFEAVRLPLPASEMPTALAWRSDGTLLLTSLKGQAWAALDSDRDGLPETLQAISDELAAPYGIAERGAAVDVINKSGLLRLSQFDSSGRATRVDVVADGWGHTDDYHDWAVGLVPDEAGGYFAALPCRQDERTEAEARLRGWAVHLVPNTSAGDAPRAFDVVPLCAGLRFPMGLARNRAGDLFASDNQGNYNPFNELNHLQPGAHYGFFNKIEAKTLGGDRPPRRDAAIEIPHPWTRSVNGICFLDTPAELRARTGRDAFGPWEGHLVGCEYDTRRLVRMTLEQVGGMYQGAVYPLSTEPAEVDAGFEGPVVCQVGPDAALYVGNMRDSGWGAGQNTGSIVRLRPTGEPMAGIAEIRALETGFRMRFSQPVDSRLAGNVNSYALSAFRRIPTSEYGGPDVDRHDVRIERAIVSADAREVTITLPRMRAGFVYEFHVKNLAGAGKTFHPAEAYYTLREVVGGKQ